MESTFSNKNTCSSYTRSVSNSYSLEIYLRLCDSSFTPKGIRPLKFLGLFIIGFLCMVEIQIFLCMGDLWCLCTFCVCSISQKFYVSPILCLSDIQFRRTAAPPPPSDVVTGCLRYDENILPPSNFGKLNKRRIKGNELTTIFLLVCST